VTAAIFFEGGLIQLLLGGAFLLFTRRFWCWCYLTGAQQPRGYRPKCVYSSGVSYPSFSP
jgi:hypothetical protein